MQEHHNFEYAVIRIVPQVEREEFLNVGVVLYCKKHKFLQVKYQVNKQRLIALNPKSDPLAIEQHLEAYRKIADGSKEAGPIALLDLSTRFRWLTAKRSTIVQSSAVHPGLCTDPLETLQKLYEQLVLV